MANKVIVVRVGQRETRIVHMEHKNTNPVVYGCVRFPTPEGAVQDGVIVDMAELAVGIHRTCEEKGIKTKDVIFTIASGKIASRDVSIPVVNKAKIDSLVMAKASDLFPIDTEKYVFSYVMQGAQRKNEEGDNVQDVMVFAAPSELIDSYYTLADAAGLHIVALEADGNAVFQIMKRRVQDKVSMSVQMNRSATLINIISDDRLLLQRVIPYGINVFTEVMTADPVFQTPTEDEAYLLLKRNRVLVSQTNADNEKNNLSIEKRIEVTNNSSFLFSNITRVIEYYNTKYKEKPIEEIVLMGEGCAVAGIHELMTNELGIHTFTPDEIVGIHFSRIVNVNAFILQYINCFGSVFEPVGFVSQAVSQRAGKKESLTASLLVFAGFFAISIALAVFSIFQVFSAQDERDIAQIRANSLSIIQSQHEELTKTVSNYNLMKKLEYGTDSNNNHFHNLIRQLSERVPKTFRIQSIQSDEEKVTISAVSSDRLSSLTALQLQLNEMEGIQDVSIDEVSDAKEGNKHVYSYTLTFVYQNAKTETQEEVQ